VDWASVAGAGISFAIAKATEGTNVVDPTFDVNYAGIKGAGLVRGAYHFFHASQDPVAQANLCLSKIGMFGPGDLPPVLDVEIADNQPPFVIINAIQQWLTTVQQAIGRPPIIYTSSGFWSQLGNPTISGYPLWIANWGVTCPNVPAPWSNWAFWQYSDSGTVSGIPATVDLDQFNGGISALLAMTGPPPPNSAPIVLHPIPDQVVANGFTYTFPANTFSDPDAGQTLTYTATNLPAGITFDGPTRTFSGTAVSQGTFMITVTATDNGVPPLSASCTFQITVQQNQSATVCPSGTILNGLNVSQDNGTVDWKSIGGSKAAFAFAFARVSDGTNADSQFDANYAGIQAAGMFRGAYQLFHPSQDPVAQANLFLSKVGMPGPGDLPPALDVEVTDGLTAKEIDSALQAWATTMQKAIGRAPIIYCSANFWNSSVGSASFSNDPLWVADWGVVCPTLPSAWTGWKFWQTSGSGVVPGISGAVDLDIFNGSQADLAAMTGLPAPTNQPPILVNPIPTVTNIYGIPLTTEQQRCVEHPDAD
jgi:lysozyme